MRMTNNNRPQPPPLINKLYRLLIQQRDQIPKDVSGGCLQEHGALADGEFGGCVDGVDVRGDGVAGYGVGVGGEEVRVGGP